jgi:hypothetical protein
VAEVGDGGRVEIALRALDEEQVAAQLVEDGPEVAKVIDPCLAVN